MAPNFTPDDRRRLIERSEELLGQKKLATLIEKHRDDPNEYPHRLIDLLLRMRRAEEHAGDPFADNVSCVAGTEVSGVLDEIEAWRKDPVWPECQRALNESREYVHAVVTLCFGNALRAHHLATELVAAKGSTATPDLRMTVTVATSLAVEVKAPVSVGSRSQSMTPFEANAAVTKALKEAVKQLAGGPGMLVIGGCNIDLGTFDALGDAAGGIVERGRSDSNLMSIVIANLLVAVGDHALGLSGTEIGFGLKTRIRSNWSYSGPIKFVGEWGGKWQLVPRDA